MALDKLLTEKNILHRVVMSCKDKYSWGKEKERVMGRRHYNRIISKN